MTLLVNPLMPRIRPRRLQVNPLVPILDEEPKAEGSPGPMQMMGLAQQLLPLLGMFGGTGTSPTGPAGGPPKFSSMPGV